MQVFHVSRRGIPVGELTLNAEGLYCRLRFLTQNTGEILRLVDRRETGDYPIGICGPVSGGFGIEKRIPAKYMNGVQHEFVITSHSDENASFYPIDGPIPVQVLKHPENCRYTVRNNKPGIVISCCPGCTRYCPSE